MHLSYQILKKVRFVVNTISKKCGKCSETKNVSEFNLNRASKDGRECKSNYARFSKENNTLGIMLRGTKSRAKAKNLDFNITKSDIHLPNKCPILGIELHIGKGKSTPNSPTIDRIDSSKGYIKGNVQIISHRANTMKSDATLDEIRLLCTYMEDNYDN